MSGDIGTIPTLEELADRLAIAEVLAAHSRGLDRLDLPLLQACYWPDAEVDYGSFRGEAQQFAALVIPALEGQYELTRHALSNTLIDLRGDRARVESLVSAAHLLKSNTEEMLFSGRYLDALEKRGEQWKLMHRQVVIDWSRRRPFEDERNSEAFAALAKGGHCDVDPLYPFLNQA